MNFYEKCSRLRDVYLTLDTCPESICKTEIIKQLVKVAFEGNDTLPVSKDFIVTVSLWPGYDEISTETLKKNIKNVLNDLDYKNFILISADNSLRVSSLDGHFIKIRILG